LTSRSLPGSVGAAASGKVSLRVVATRAIVKQPASSAETKPQSAISTCTIPQTNSIAPANQFIKAIHIAESISIA
jgi:hypothetical protein